MPRSRCKSKAEVDVIIVLGASSGSGPSDALLRRIERGIALCREYPTAQLLLCGGDTGGRLAEAPLMARLALDADIAEDRIVEENRSTSTWENALFAEVLIERFRWRSACLVTDRFHLVRAWLVFRRTQLEVIYLKPAGPVPIMHAAMMWAREIIAILWYLLRLAATRRREKP